MSNRTNLPTMSSGGCPECDINQMARNHYFTGKLLVERDFTDEQRYTMGKLRRHNQRLHGWGAVCGLKVKEHPNPACQGQYVLIEPGTAIDCCGREIVVPNEEYLDFHAAFLAKWQQQYAPATTPDTNPHTIQICVSYKECPTENVPALFDDCGGNAGSCQPNRILESYAFDVLIDPPVDHHDAAGVQLDWRCTVGIQNPVAVAKCDAVGLLYVLASDKAGTFATLYQVDADNNSVVTASTLPVGIGLDVAVSTKGDFVYVALQPAGATPQVLVLKTDALGTIVSTLTPPGTSGDIVRLAVIPDPDDRLIAVFPSKGVYVWATGIQSNAAAPKNPIAGTGSVDIAVTSNGATAYVTNSAGTIGVITLSSLAVNSITAGLAGTAPSAIAVATTTANTDTVAVIDATNKAVVLISVPSSFPSSALPAPTQIGNSTISGFKYPPLDLAISPGGRWVYVLEADPTTNPSHGYVQAINEHAFETQQTHVLGDPVPAGLQPAEAVLSLDGKELYIPYTSDDPSIPGSIAVLKISQADCADIFDQAIECCPDCDDGTCIVLATITGYSYGDSIVDAKDGIAPGNDQIDNLSNRHILLSTDLLTKIVRCLLNQGAGAGTTGEQGPPGPAGANGAAGAAITEVNPTFVPCDQPGAAALTPNATGLTLDLTIPGACNPNLVGIKSISWKHGGAVATNTLIKPGLKIAFTSGVQAVDISSESVELLIPIEGTAGTFVRAELLPMTIKIIAGNFTPTGDTTGQFITTATSGATSANGLEILLSDNAVKLLAFASEEKLPIWVLVKGDFIRDTSPDMHAVDGDHLPPWLATPPTATQRSGDGIEGGTFESWFTITE